VRFPRLVVVVALVCGAACAPARRAVRAAPARAVTVSSSTPTTVSVGRRDGTEVIAHGSRAVPKVALTFDTNMTDAMLAELDRSKVQSFVNQGAIDELRRLRVPATIFLAGKWVERYPDVTRSLAADPLFELASHSYAHRAFKAPCYGLGAAMPVAEMAPDVERSEQLLRQFTDHPTPYFRFPGGCYDKAALDAVASTGVVVVQYDVASGDAFGTSVNAIVDQTLREATDGSIVVLHLTGGDTAPLTALALPRIVDGLRGRGLQLVKLSDLLAST